MIKPFPGRGAKLAAVTAALALGATGVASAELQRGYDFNAGSLAPSYDAVTSAPALAGVTTTDDTFDATAGEGYVLSVLGGTSAEYTIALTVDLTTVDPASEDWMRILNVAGSNAENGGLYLHDGVLAWRNSNGTLAQEGGSVLDTDDEQIVVTRDGGELSVYNDGALAFTVTDPEAAGLSAANGVQLFLDGDSAERTAAGTIERLRFFSHALSADEVADLSPRDVLDPQVELQTDLGYNGTHWDGSQLWAGPFPYFAIEGADDGTAPLAVNGAVRTVGGSVVVNPSMSGLGYPEVLDNELLTTFTGLSFNLSSLTDGGQYRFTATVADRAGHDADIDQLFRSDLTSPAGLTLDTPGETDDKTPAIGGSAAVGARDDNVVYATICKGDSCYDGEDFDEYLKDLVGSVSAEIVNGKWGSSDIRPIEMRRAAGTVGDLPVGTYHVVARQFDAVFNEIEVAKTIKIVDPKAATPTPSPVVVTPPAPQLLAPAALLARNRQSIIASLLKERLRGLTKDGKADVDVFVDRPAQVIVQLFDGTAPKKVDPKAKAAAKKKKKAKKPASKLIASGKKAFAAAGAGKVTVRLTKRGRSLLRNKKSRRISVRTIIVPRGGAPIVDTHKLTVKR